ncbi:hypothetical protein AB0G32_25990 [Streptomyces sp. NPDC023723]|uniref:hypothetical protein n=1 Tax=Streptomyces sp. NPDC023723 TaxID=3154323 RepID=UPI0033E26DAD
MRIRMAGISLSGLLLTAGLLGLTHQAVGEPAWNLLFEYGCGDPEDRLGEALAADAVLAAGPAGAGTGRPYRSCDDDDLFVVAGASYRYPGTGASVRAHYRTAAPAQGWRPRTDACYTKRIGGTTAYLTLEEPAGRELAVEIIADRDGGAWC